jgi:hypothetical protein
MCRRAATIVATIVVNAGMCSSEIKALLILSVGLPILLRTVISRPVARFFRAVGWRPILSNSTKS